MDLPRTGCNEIQLIYISTPKFEFVIKGKPCHPKAQALAVNVGKISKIKIRLNESVDSFTVQIAGVDTQTYDQKLSSKFIKIIECEPLFFENQDYQILIEKKCDEDIKFWHENAYLRDSVDYVGRDKRLLMGKLNFASEIGFSDLHILVNGNDYLALTIEIFPSKIDYATDYANIMLDVNKEIYNLVFDFLRKTYFGATLRWNEFNSPTEFFAIIDTIFKKFISAVDYIIQRPYHVLYHEDVIVPAHKAKNCSKETIKWLQKNPARGEIHDGEYTPEKVLMVKKTISYDTFENRLVKYILRVVVRKLSDLLRSYTKLERLTDSYFTSKIEYMKVEVQRRIDFSFLKDVGNIHTMSSMTLVINMAPGYRDVYKYYLMLLKGISLNGDIFRISVKDLALLYEYWCFIKISSLLKGKYQLVKQDFIKISNNGLFVTLKKGRESNITYKNPANNEKFTLSYNSLVGDLPTLSQKPDNILKLQKIGSQIEYEYVFDAKYRINPAFDGSNYAKNYGTPGPEEDDINTMHRYRDSIVHKYSSELRYSRKIFGAYVLFPYNNEEEYKNHRFFKSIEEVNVGGLPFLPSATTLVEDLIQELVDDTPLSAIERSNFPIGLDEYIENIDFGERNVLVGTLRNKEQFDICVSNKMYYIPYEKVRKNILAIRYVALYQSKKEFGEQAGITYFGKIKYWKVVQRKEISQIPRDDSKLYVLFEVEDWQKMSKTIEPGRYGVRSHFYTTLKLMNIAKTLPELWISSKDEYRLYLELKRVADKLEIKETEHTTISNKETPIEFMIQNAIISINSDKIDISVGDKIESIEKKEFIAKPRTVIKRLKNVLKLK